MILKTQEFKKVCQKISSVVDSKDGLSDKLELITQGKTLFLNVTNNEYFVSVKFNIDSDEVVDATINASLFLKLISQLTTDEIDLTLKNTYINIKSNGDYKIPLIFSGDKMMRLNKIEIYNPTTEMDVDVDILESIEKYNSKELLKGVISNGVVGAVQRLHYLDNQGAITFTTGACINNFTLEKPIRVLLNNKVVKLFSLFEEKEEGFSTVHLTLGYDELSNGILQTKIRFENKDVCITSILNCDNSLLGVVPVSKIRERAETVYPYYVDIHKNSLLQALNRITLFVEPKDATQTIGLFTFEGDTLTISDVDKKNTETLKYECFSNIDHYEAYLNINDLKLTISNYNEQYVNIGFGNHESLTIPRLNIINILSECEIDNG